LFDKVSIVIYFIVLFIFIQNVGGGGKRACENPKEFSMGVGFRGKKGSMGLLEKGV